MHFSLISRIAAVLLLGLATPFSSAALISTGLFNASYDPQQFSLSASKSNPSQTSLMLGFSAGNNQGLELMTDVQEAFTVSLTVDSKSGFNHASFSAFDASAIATFTVGDAEPVLLLRADTVVNGKELGTATFDSSSDDPQNGVSFSPAAKLGTADLLELQLIVFNLGKESLFLNSIQLDLTAMGLMLPPDGDGSVPEPSTAVMAVIGLVALLTRRRIQLRGSGDAPDGARF